MSIKITIEGDDRDELLTAAKGIVEMLEGEAAEETEDEESEETEDEETEETEDEESEETADEDEDSEADELLAKIRKQIAKLVKTDTGPAKVKAAFAKLKVKKLDQVKPAKYAALGKLLGVK